jgi:hypothetical protein
MIISTADTMSLFGSQLEVPDSPMWQMEPYQEPWEMMPADSPLNTAFYLHQADSQPSLPPNAQEMWQTSPDFHGLAGLMDLPPLPPLAAEPEPDPVTVALIQDAETKLKAAQDKLSAYQAKIAERRCHKSKADQAKRTKELEKEIGAAERWLTMVSAY